MVAAGPIEILDLMHEVEPPLHRGACSTKLEGWLKQLLSPDFSLDGLPPYVTLLRCCNTALSLVRHGL